MGREEVFDILKKKKKWMSNRDIKKYVDLSKTSIGRASRTLYRDFSDMIDMKIVKTTSHDVFYYKYIGK